MSGVLTGTLFTGFTAGSVPVGAILLLIVGFVLLVKGADYFVEGASSIAKQFHVPTLIIGLTICAMGTSLPEAAVSISSSLINANQLAVSNVVGSNIFNLMGVIGICAIMTPIAVQKSCLLKEFPFSIVCAILLLVVGILGMVVGRIDGVILLVLFAAYLAYMIISAKKASASGAAVEDENVELAESIAVMPLWKSILCILLGGCGVILGGEWVVTSAKEIALSFGMSETLVGLTIVSIGTSLPELVTSIVAAKKNDVDMALGNVVGSNIFNILFILGMASAISPMPMITNNFIDLAILIGFSLIVWVMGWTSKKINRAEGIVMVLMYIAYVVYIVMRDGGATVA